MAAHNELGRRGEKLAQDFLVGEGYTIRDTNWKSGHYELDIVAEKDSWLVVVEVKTRSSAFFGQPESFIDNAKMKRLGVATHHYILEHEITSDTRFDVISVLIFSDGKHQLEHLKNAFSPR
jgi:putative endonuclease